VVVPEFEFATADKPASTAVAQCARIAGHTQN
jgi:hypothetical protein